MATASTVTLDANTYTVLLYGYAPWYNKGERNTLTVSGKDDTVFPTNGQQGWNLVLKCDITELTALLATWAKKSTVAFTDNLGNGHTVVCLGALEQRTLTVMLDGANALYHVPVALKVRQ